MSFDDALSRLRAGLDEDERIARAAFTNHTPGADRWRADGMQVWNEATTSTLVVGHTWPREARHIARQDPKATLDWVEAIRKVIARYEFVTGHGPAVDHTRAMDMTVGATAALRDVIEMLASAYPADETEGANP